MNHNYSKEILYHFNCGKCNKWWTIADHHLLFKENKITCPHCGHKENSKEIKKDKISKGIYNSNEKRN